MNVCVYDFRHYIIQLNTNLLFIFQQWSADATKQSAVGTEQLRQEFDALKLTLERKYDADMVKYKADIEKLTMQVSEQKADIDTYQTNNMKMQEKVEMLMRQVDDLTRTNGEQQQMEEVFLSGYRNRSTSGNYVHQPTVQGE